MQGQAFISVWVASLKIIQGDKKLKILIKYQANDGCEFNDKKLCEQRDEELRIIHEVTQACLKPTPTDCNWDGYVQQHRESVLDYKRVLMKIAKSNDVYGDISKSGDAKSIWDADPAEVHPRGIAGRFIDDSGQQHLNCAWHRFVMHG